MHEMGIALEIIDIVRASLPAGRVTVEAVHLEVGKLSAVVADSLRFCFEVASQDTPVAGARLVIDEIPVRARCRDCGMAFTVEDAAFLCPGCGGPSLDLLSGRELDIRSIEILDEEDHDHDP